VLNVPIMLAPSPAVNQPGVFIPRPDGSAWDAKIYVFNGFG
jgi:hypothetical protein